MDLYKAIIILQSVLIISLSVFMFCSHMAQTKERELQRKEHMFELQEVFLEILTVLCHEKEESK